MTVTWTTSEWSETTLSAYEAGYSLEVSPDAEALGGEWWWAVKMTASISEYPEVYDCGFKPTQDEAQTAAETALAKARRGAIDGPTHQRPA